MRIGELARATGTTVRTIRYYEEIGLLPAAGERGARQHRHYDETDAQRLRELLRLKDLLGVSLHELRALMAAEEARRLLRAEFRSEDTPPARREAILIEARANVERQQALVARRREQLDELDRELRERHALIRTRLTELGVSAEV